MDWLQDRDPVLAGDGGSAPTLGPVRSSSRLCGREDRPLGVGHRPHVGTGMKPAGTKAGYARHFLALNPAGATDEGYASARPYYEAELRPLLPRDAHARLLDFGCGLGYLLRFFLDAGFSDVSGVELDPDLHRLSVEHVGHRGASITRADGMAFLESNPGRFDFITFIDVIEHFTLEEAIEIVRAAHGALAPGGAVVLRTPNMANVLGVYSRYMDITHRYAYTEQSLAQLLQLAGFTDATLHVPDWTPLGARAATLAESARIHAHLFALMGRATPRCFDKNVVMSAHRAGADATP
jgi:2-polyprenyl-3-methyl-5-hydroxy-6-metoxy-1,4-benzoquinol methylase